MARLPFECKLCGECCSGRGGIYLKKEEIPAAAEQVELSPQVFTERYCQERDGLFEVLSDEKGVCRLLGPKGCRIHRAKPEICCLWPFFPAMLKHPEALEEAKEACPGIDPQVSHEEFVAYYQKAILKKDNP